MSKKNSQFGSNQKPNSLILRRTLILMVVCGIVAFAVLAGQLYKIQIVQHDYYEGLAVEQQVRETTVTASRGTIYDRNLKILAMSGSVDTVYISPAEMLRYEEDPKMIASGLSEILDVPYDTIMAKWEDTASWYKTVAVKIEQELSDKVRAFKNENSLKSVHIISDTKRYYPYGTLASQVVGFVGTDNTGLEGVEALCNSYLQGSNGRIIRETTGEGTEMLFTDFEDYIDSKNGDNVVLTIDAIIQHYLEKNLQQAIEDYSIKNGAMGIVMDVNTAEILGMATLPKYDLNNYLEVSDEVKEKLALLTDEEYSAQLRVERLKQWRNRALGDTYEPGSTFKIITLAIALEEGVVSENDSFYCGGAIQVKGRKADDPVHCWKHEGHGSQTLEQAAQHSCNVAFVDIGLKIGGKLFYDYIEAFGFFQKTGIELSAAESSSIWWDEKTFEDPTNYSQLAAASFGQTFNITPLQLITAISAVANGGNLMQPYIIKQIVDDDGNVIKNTQPTVVRQVISEETSKKVCSILEAVVGGVEGTGKNAYVAGYRIAGKTGTSEKVGQASDDYIVSFVGFAPADDPQVAVLVLLDSPARDSGIYISGGVMAAPTVGNIMADILPYLGVDTVYTSEEAQNIDQVVPNVRSLGVDEAKNQLEALGFSTRVVGNGSVVTDQLPMANIQVADGTKIILYADEPRPEETVEMPDIVGKSFSRARNELESAGLYIHSTGVSNSGSSTIVVSKQSVTAGEEVAVGSVITVTLVDSDTSIMER